MFARTTIVFTRVIFLASALLAFDSSSAQDLDNLLPEYSINPGDVLSIHIWGEAELSRPEVLVRPDGRISLPLVGQLVVGGRTVSDLQLEVSKKLSTVLIDNPAVTISVMGLTGNTIYVLGKVARPGEFIIRKSTDVAQALALAGGVTTFAKQNSIKILRRNSSGDQVVFKFRYSNVEDGNNLEDNIILQSGDIVLVP